MKKKLIILLTLFLFTAFSVSAGEGTYQVNNLGLTLTLDDHFFGAAASDPTVTEGLDQLGLNPEEFRQFMEGNSVSFWAADKEDLTTEITVTSIPSDALDYASMTEEALQQEMETLKGQLAGSDGVEQLAMEVYRHPQTPMLRYSFYNAAVTRYISFYRVRANHNDIYFCLASDQPATSANKERFDRMMSTVQIAPAAQSPAPVPSSDTPPADPAAPADLSPWLIGGIVLCLVLLLVIAAVVLIGVKRRKKNH